MDSRIDIIGQDLMERSSSVGQGALDVALAVEGAASGEGSRDHGPGRPPLYSEDHFKAVADVYREAWRDTGQPRKAGRPRKAVADRWKVSPSTAAKWVARAREMGFLPPTGQGRAA